jgi:ubiquinone/menaquinone biosynthesis C-methylase UbiE
MAATRKPKKNTQNFYDRIAEVHNLALKVNGYRRSMAKYLRSLDLEIGPDSAVLDAGSGTGIVSLGFQDSGLRPKIAVTFDISRRSLKVGC